MSVATRFVQRLFPDETPSWEKLALPIAGFLNCAGDEDDYKSAWETVLILDTAAQSKAELNNVLRSRLSANLIKKLGFETDGHLNNFLQVLLVTGRAIQCFQCTRLVLAEQRADRTNNNTPRSLGGDFPWLAHFFTPTTICTLDGWADWVRGCLDTVEDLQPFCEKYYLGARYYMLWRALYQYDDEEKRKANDCALFYAQLVCSTGTDILRAVVKQMPRLPISEKEIIEKVTRLTSKGEN